MGMKMLGTWSDALRLERGMWVGGCSMRSTETMRSLGDRGYVREVGCVRTGLCVSWVLCESCVV